MKRYFAITLFILTPILSFSQSLSAEYSQHGVLIKEGSDKVLFYQKEPKSHDHKYTRAHYIHPLYDLEGNILTEDFPKDHLHHRGIFWTWHKIFIGDKAIGDAWECKDFEWLVYCTNDKKNTDGSLTLQAKAYWQSHLWVNGNGIKRPFVKDEAFITIYPKIQNYRIIDFDIRILALVENVKIGGSDDEKGYGGFSLRVKMPESLSFKSKNGDVLPTNLAVEAGSWMDVTGLSGKIGQSGLVIMCHPTNPAPLNQWILRKKGSMQNPVFPGRELYPLSDQMPLRLKYRLVLYDGKLKKGVINKIYKSF